MARTTLIAAAAALLACSAGAAARDRINERGNWRTLASPEDRDRIRSWRGAWTAALKKARTAGFGERIDAAGSLLEPDASLGGAMPGPGAYTCRVFKIGAVPTAAAMRDFIAEPASACRIEPGGGLLGLAKLDGAQRPAGWLYPDGQRMIFLGSMRMADERRPLPYGGDPERDMAGILERIGPDRWRLVLPRPRWETMLTVVELRPAR
jgi:hypothetical protein